MIIYTNELPFEYELEKLTRLFFPFEKVVFSYSEPEVTNGLHAVAKIIILNEKTYLIASAGINGKIAKRKTPFDPFQSKDPDKEKNIERALAAELFDCY